ncbi:PAS domain S-box-containing protein/diguanylate cyclase (GGDEF) domain-containing protein [Oceanospirillum multiglobuliferum]|uniref:Diguanylate cyclase n=1 Tax=Oceanospirillum multiglobuliferum TaxID=64969 RepID=A0A1T4PVB2_9GAMM|nr:diguanylate cyclase [Oceanospirillum multiglobuliferum]OPX55308.1 hypothetical protein BTE48_09055 [Oceanospirillum multiglobuliferum]SJZ95197.1 PAS domain S-box-containing protein/diguanylate cyclase (GGDEF) domain-containing protein [Oceanospirillum multiglobuliferum]
MERKANILIAEDDVVTQLMLSRFISQQGYTPICASDGDEALRLSSQHQIDLALLDANMPLKDGFTCCKILYEQHGDLLPVLMVTALEDEDSIDRAFNAGAVDFIAKPINWAVLRNRLKYLLKMRSDRLALQTSEARKAALINHAIDSIISVNSHGRIINFNPASEAIFGYEETEVVDVYKIDRLLPDYTQLVYRMLVNTHLTQVKKNQRHETLAIDKNGNAFTVEVVLSQAVSNNEVITTVMLHDITERKKHEEELQLAATVFNFCNEGIMITNQDNIVEAVNPSFTEITGYTLEEVIGKNPKLLNSGSHSQDFYDKMWQSICNEGGWQGEIINKKKDGSQYNEWLSIRTVKTHANKQPQRYVAIFSDITQRKAAEYKVWWQAHYDSLTGLPNRSLFMQTLSSAMLEEQPLSLMFIDLDGFKAVNDHQGHASGDVVLQKVAKRLQNELPESALVARLGGDEFTVLLKGAHSEVQLLEIGHLLVASISQPYLLSASTSAHISASIGIASYPRHGTHIDELINAADQMMYEVKLNGKSSVRLASTTVID